MLGQMKWSRSRYMGMAVLRSSGGLTPHSGLRLAKQLLRTWWLNSVRQTLFTARTTEDCPSIRNAHQIKVVRSPSMALRLESMTPTQIPTNRPYQIRQMTRMMITIRRPQTAPDFLHPLSASTTTSIMVSMSSSLYQQHRHPLFQRRSEKRRRQTFHH